MTSLRSELNQSNLELFKNLLIFASVNHFGILVFRYIVVNKTNDCDQLKEQSNLKSDENLNENNKKPADSETDGHKAKKFKKVMLVLFYDRFMLVAL